MKYGFSLGLFLMGCGAIGCGNTVQNETGGAGGTGGGTGGSTTGTMPNGGGGAGGGTGGGDPVPGQQSATFGPLTVKSGSENTQCIQVRLKNMGTLRAHQIHNVLSQGSHHMIVYKTNDTTEKLTPYDCQPFVDTLNPEKGLPLMITQKHDDLLTLPANVAYTLDPMQMIRLEVHFINATANDIDVTATTTFLPIADSDYKYEGGFLFLGDPDINIAPMSTAKLGPVFLPLTTLLPDLADKAKFFALTGHEHQWGTNVTVSLAKDANDPGTSLYDVPNWSWSEPQTVNLDPEVTVPKGGGFKFSCEWNNKSMSAVKFGESANNEMCFFWAYYYPSNGAFVCVHTDQVGGASGYNLCCPGNPICAKVFGN
jgi:hypothetical protein